MAAQGDDAAGNIGLQGYRQPPQVLDELLGELPAGLRLSVKTFLRAQQLDSLEDLAVITQDDLTEAFKLASDEFTLGHRAAVRRLCTSARELLEGAPSEAPASQPATPSVGPTLGARCARRGPAKTQGQLEEGPLTPRMSCVPEDSWDVVKPQRCFDKVGQNARRSPRRMSDECLRPSPSASMRRDASPKGFESGIGAPKPSYSRKGSFSMAGRGTCRETAWSRAEAAAEPSPGPYYFKPAMMAKETQTRRPTSPRPVIGTARRDTMAFVGNRGTASPGPTGSPREVTCTTKAAAVVGGAFGQQERFAYSARNRNNWIAWGE